MVPKSENLRSKCFSTELAGPGRILSYLCEKFLSDGPLQFRALKVLASPDKYINLISNRHILNLKDKNNGQITNTKWKLNFKIIKI